MLLHFTKETTVTKIKIMLAALFLAGCSGGVSPGFDLGPVADSAADASTVDAAIQCPATPAECERILLCPAVCTYVDGGPDAGEPDGGTPDAGMELDLGPPDAGPAPCTHTVDARICLTDNLCCNRACRSDGTCPADANVAAFFCTCAGGIDTSTSCEGAAECTFAGSVCACT